MSFGLKVFFYASYFVFSENWEEGIQNKAKMQHNRKTNHENHDLILCNSAKTSKKAASYRVSASSASTIAGCITQKASLNERHTCDRLHIQRFSIIPMKLVWHLKPLRIQLVAATPTSYSLTLSVFLIPVNFYNFQDILLVLMSL